MINILINILAICGIIIFSAVAIFLLIIAIFIIIYAIKSVKKELNKK